MYVDEKPSDRQEGFLSLYDFYYEKKELPRVEGYSGDKVIDYEIDSDLIYSAFYECYNIDLYENTTALAQSEGIVIWVKQHKTEQHNGVEMFNRYKKQRDNET